MRLPIAVFTLALCSAAASTQDFRVTELLTYSGNVPCADCVGIRYVLSLRPDGRFYRQRTYLRSENTGQILLDLGVWSAQEGVLALMSSTQEQESFAAASPGTLLLLEREGGRDACASRSDLNCTLTRESRGYVPLGSYRIRGVYREKGGRRTFQPCGSKTPLPAETSGRPLLLQRLSTAVSGGKPALLTATGAFEQATDSQAGETLRLANVLTAQPGGVCPAMAPNPTLSTSGDPAASARKAHTGAAALLVGTSWVLTEIGRKPPPSGVGEGEASLHFLEAGRVSGFTGCNRFSGDAALSGASVHFGPVMATRMACPASANIEVDYMKALEAARQVDLDGDSLYLLDAAGHRIAGFRALRAK